MYFLGSSLLLNSFALGFYFTFHFCSILSCLLTFVSNFPSSLFTNFFALSKSSPLSYISLSTVNPFHWTKYLSTSLIFLLFNILSTSHSLTPSTSIGLTSSFFCTSTCFLYCTIQLTVMNLSL